MEKENIMGYLFSRSSRSYKKAINQALEKHNLTTVQCGVIRTLKHNGSLTQAEIAEIFSSDRATIGSVIQKLLDKDYLNKELSNTDKRAYIVSLTPKAIKIADEIEEISAMIEQKALAGLSKEEIEMFYKTLNRIVVNLDREEG